MTTDALSLRATATGVRVDLRVIPRAPKEGVAGIRDGRVLLRVSAPPVDHAANSAVVELLAAALRLPKRSVRLVAGETSRNKSVEIDGITADAFRRMLNV